jgi:hypothetical protein
MSNLAQQIFPQRILDRVVHCKRGDYDVLVDRSTPWGNPIRLADHPGRPEALLEYLWWLHTIPKSDRDPQHVDQYDQRWVHDHVNELRGETLACWCSPRLCHGHVLAAMAASDDPMEAVSWILDRLVSVQLQKKRQAKTKNKAKDPPPDINPEKWLMTLTQPGEDR